MYGLREFRRRQPYLGVVARVTVIPLMEGAGTQAMVLRGFADRFSLPAGRIVR